jgi:hypothetical protein
MLFAQHRLAQSEYLSRYLFRLLVLALIPQHRRQVIHARQCQDALCRGIRRQLRTWPALHRSIRRGSISLEVSMEGTFGG